MHDELTEQMLALEPGSHLCLFYEHDPAEQMGALVPFIQEGLARHEQCIYVADDQTIEQVTRELEAHCIQVRDESARQALLLWTRNEWRQPGPLDSAAKSAQVREIVDAARDNGFTGIRFAIEMTWTLEPEITADRLMQWEATLNHLISNPFPTRMVCQYNRQRLSPGALQAALRTHAQVILGNRVYPNQFYEAPLLATQRTEGDKLNWMLGQLEKARLAERDRETVIRQQAALAEKERSGKRTEEILDRIADAFVALDREWRFTYINRAAHRTFERLGKTTETVPGARIWEVMPELVGTQVYDEFQRAMRDQVTVSFEYLYPQINAWFDVHAYPSSEGVSIYLEDVTERKRAEMSLARLGAIIESSDDAIVSKNLDGIIQSWNSGAERIFGYRAQEVVGQPISIIYPPDHLDEFPRIMARLRAGERIRHYETVRRRKDGTLIEVSVSISPVKDAEGNIVGASKIARDITESKRAERSQQFLVRAGEILASSLDYETTLSAVARLAVPRLADWCVIDILDREGNLRELEVAHKDPEKVKWGWELRKRYPLDMNSTSGVPQVVRTGKSEVIPYISEEMLVAGAKTPEDLELFHSIGFSSAMVVPLAARGRVLGTIELVATESGHHYGDADLAIAEELAYRAGLAVDNARLYREAQEAIQAREQFLSIASHELRTPLTSVYGYTQLLQRLIEKVPSPDGQGDLVTLDRERLTGNLKKLQDQSERLMGLISELLDLTRLQQGHLTLDKQQMDLSVLVDSVVRNMREQQALGMYPGNISFRVVLPVAGTVSGRWDVGRLEQLISNLLNNAIKYSPKGGIVDVRLSVESGSDYTAGQIHPATAGGRHAHLIVQDQGIGIPLDQQGRLFQPFFRATNARGTSAGGLGLGLAICKGIVQAHGGSIRAASSGPNQGSTFHVILPEVAPASDQEAAEGLDLETRVDTEGLQTWQNQLAS